MITKDDCFAQNIKNLRKSLGLTQQEMADVIGVRKTTICNYESGYARPTINTLKIIMEKFRLPSTYFFSDNDVNRKYTQPLFGITIPFYSYTNTKGLLSKDKSLMDSPLTLPNQVEFSKNDSIATIVPDNSMNRCGIKKGSCVIINTSKMPTDGKIFAAVRDGNLIIRMYHNNSSGTYMTAESTRIPAGLSFEEIPTENFELLGTITKIISDI